VASPGGQWYAAQVVGDRLYAATDTGLQVISIADPARPTVLGGETGAPRAWDVAVDGTRAYVASGVEGLRVVDVSDTTRPRQVGSAVMAQVRLPAVPRLAPVG
jgi:hypothetical protein